MKSKLNTIALILAFWGAGTLISCKDKPATVDTTALPAEEKKLSTEVIENLTTITFERDLHDFGEMIQNEVVHTEFKFTNTGSHDLIISSARGTCGCTKPEWPTEPIPPGASGVIKVGFDSKNKSGPFNKTVTVTANTNPAESRIIIKGVVIVPKDK